MEPTIINETLSLKTTGLKMNEADVQPLLVFAHNKMQFKFIIRRRCCFEVDVMTQKK